MTKNKRLMFVYGTLKKGERLHGLLQKQKRIGTAITYESVVAMELNAGYELVNTIVETEDGKEHIAEMFLVEETPAKAGGNTILTNKRIVTTDNVKEWTTKV